MFDEVASTPEPYWVEINAADVRVENCRQFGGPWQAAAKRWWTKAQEFSGDSCSPSGCISWFSTGIGLIVERPGRQDTPETTAIRVTCFANALLYYVGDRTWLLM
jgi:hypothetical protein